MMNIGRRSSTTGSGWRCSKALFRITLLFGLIWLLWVGVLLLENEEAKLNAHHEVTMIEGGSTKHVEMVEKRLPNYAHENLEINFVSKRRIPNGPDPIHNRRAGNSHRPPGRA